MIWIILGICLFLLPQIIFMRAYNFDSKRADIKVLKNYKFKGAYALYNVDKNFYYTGFSNDIFRKIDRHFRGYGNIRLYEEW